MERLFTDIRKEVEPRVWRKWGEQHNTIFRPIMIEPLLLRRVTYAFLLYFCMGSSYRREVRHGHLKRCIAGFKLYLTYLRAM